MPVVDITFIKNYAQRLQDAVEGISYNRVIIDDSQLIKFVEDISASDKHLLFIVIPEFQNTGNTADSARRQTETAILVLQKTDYSNNTHDEFLDIMQATLVSANAVEAKMRADKNDYSPEGCKYMKQLNISSIYIKPVYRLAGCNGWSIEFNFEND